jgi:hypothetical protein
VPAEAELQVKIEVRLALHRDVELANCDDSVKYGPLSTIGGAPRLWIRSSAVGWYQA